MEDSQLRCSKACNSIHEANAGVDADQVVLHRFWVTIIDARTTRGGCNGWGRVRTPTTN